MELLHDNETKKINGGGQISAGAIVIITGLISGFLGFIDGITNPLSCNARRYSYFN